ncbi:hypothetical protein EB052_01875 [bacterium]|nr:hypothetical protein [bacterium]
MQTFTSDAPASATTPTLGLTPVGTDERGHGIHLPDPPALLEPPDIYWDMADVTEMTLARSFKDLFPVALRVIGRIPKDRPRSIVTGAITTGGLGSIELNAAALKKAIALLQAKGFRIFDQFPFQGEMTRMMREWHAQHGHDKYCAALIDDFYRPILEHSDLIHGMIQMPGWESSKGAIMEHEIFTAAIRVRQGQPGESHHLSITGLPVDWETNLLQPSALSALELAEKEWEKYS